VLVEHRGERWMLGVTAGGISTVAHWPQAVSADGAPSRGDQGHS
jgi:flagellar protein FliO/FliZ